MSKLQGAGLQSGPKTAASATVIRDSVISVPVYMVVVRRNENDAAADDCCTLLPEGVILMEHVITFR